MCLHTYIHNWQSDFCTKHRKRATHVYSLHNTMEAAAKQQSGNI